MGHHRPIIARMAAEAKLGCAYVMNKQGVQLMGDERPKRLIEAVYAAL